MPATVRIPSAWRKLTQNRDSVEVLPGTISSIIDELESAYPGLSEKLLAPDGQAVKYVNIYVNKEDIRFIAQLQTVAENGDEINIIPAIAGG